MPNRERKYRPPNLSEPKSADKVREKSYSSRLLYDLTTRRPFYTEEQQQVCLEVRRRNCGIDGKPVLFYANRLASSPRKPKPAKPKLAPRGKDVSALVDGLTALGLSAATGSQVEQATKALFPNGTQGMDQAEVLRAVFLHLKKNSAGPAAG